MSCGRFVYFARAGGMVKIGCSLYPETRVTSLGEWVPHKIELIGTIKGGFSLELAWHIHFAEQWSHLEWFHLTPEGLRDIEAALRGEEVKLRKQTRTSPKRIATRAKCKATRRVSQAESAAGFARLSYAARRLLRPTYVSDALASFGGAALPAPSAEALAAIERYEQELLAARQTGEAA